MKRIFPMFFWLLVLGGVVNYFLTVNHVTMNDKLKLKKAYEEYVLGEKAKSVPNRIDAFNKSLSIYAELFTKYEPNGGNGKFYYNIANNYFQLGEYPWAILYYNRAINLMPRDGRVLQNLNIALDKLGIKQEKEVNVFRKFFFFHFGLSKPEKLQLFLTLSSLVIVLSSFYIWKRIIIWKRLSFVSLFLITLLLISLIYSFYFAPIKAIFVKSTAIHRGAGVEYAKIDQEPVKAGEKVEILQVLDDGKWLKVLTNDGNIGFVSQEAAKIIDAK